MLVYAVLYPNRQVLFMLVIPVRIKWLMLILGGLEFWFLLTRPGSGVSHLAHVGGMLFGFLYLRYDRAFFRLRDIYYRRKLGRLKRKYKVYEGGKNDGDSGRGGYVQ
jgi:membrane associated rhomboid family serine protease